MLSPPLHIGKGTISAITEATCRVTITDGTHDVTGFGTVLLSHVWCWPQQTDINKDKTLRDATTLIARCISNNSSENTLLGHGFEIIAIADQLLGHLPPLARRVCCAPLDNAIHDAAGCLNQQPSFELFPYHGPSPFDSHFPGFGAASAIESMLRRPIPQLDAQMVVGLLTSGSDVKAYCSKFNIRRLKVKIGSGSVRSDVEHVVGTARSVPQDGRLVDITVDANGCYPTPDAMDEFLQSIRESAPEIAVCVSGIEQPSMTPVAEDRQRWAEIAANIPILIDESFANLEDLKLAGMCGWNGIASKSCRGQTLALLGAAWGHARGWMNTVMDLTSPNIAAIHTVLLASRISGVFTAEVNACQFLRSGYATFPESLQASIVPQDGKLTVPNVVEGLVPNEYRPVLNQLFEGE